MILHPVIKHPKTFTITICLIFILISSHFLLASSELTGDVSYTFTTKIGQSSEEQAAYDRIVNAMDSAIYYYNTYTIISKNITVEYNQSVGTADGNINGNIRFGPNKGYQVTLTAMHEIAHTIGVGTTNKWRNLTDNNKVYTGERAKDKIKEIDGSDAVLKGDDQHFWPYGLNYASEVKSNDDLINHCLIVNEIYLDLYPDKIPPKVAITQTANRQTVPFFVNIHNGVNFTFYLSSQSHIKATVFNLAGRQIAAFSQQKSHPGRHTVQFNHSQVPCGKYVYHISAGEFRKGGTFTIVP